MKAGNGSFETKKHALCSVPFFRSKKIVCHFLVPPMSVMVPDCLRTQESSCARRHCSQLAMFINCSVGAQCLSAELKSVYFYAVKALNEISRCSVLKDFNSMNCNIMFTACVKLHASSIFLCIHAWMPYCVSYFREVYAVSIVGPFPTAVTNLLDLRRL